MEELVFDTGRAGKGADNYTHIMPELAIVIGGTVPDGGELTKALDPDTMNLDPITEPPDPPDTTNVIAMKKWEMEFRDYKSKTQRRATATDSAYAKLLGQCPQTVRDKMETFTQYETIRNSLDVVGLAKLIQVALFHGSANGDNSMSYADAEQRMMQYRQKNGVSNAAYMQRFKNYVATFDFLGGRLGQTENRIEQALLDRGVTPDQATDDQKKRAFKDSRDQYLANLFLRNSHTRFEVFIAQLRCESTTKKYLDDPFPETLQEALEFLDSWDELLRVMRRSNNIVQNSRRQPDHESGMSYNTHGDDKSKDNDNKDYGKRYDSEGRQQKARRHHNPGGRNDQRGRGAAGSRQNYRGQRYSNDTRPMYDRRGDNHNLEAECEDDDGQLFEDSSVDNNDSEGVNS